MRPRLRQAPGIPSGRPPAGAPGAGADNTFRCIPPLQASLMGFRGRGLIDKAHFGRLHFWETSERSARFHSRTALPVADLFFHGGQPSHPGCLPVIRLPPHCRVSVGADVPSRLSGNPPPREPHDGPRNPLRPVARSKDLLSVRARSSRQPAFWRFVFLPPATGRPRPEAIGASGGPHPLRGRGAWRLCRRLPACPGRHPPAGGNGAIRRELNPTCLLTRPCHASTARDRLAATYYACPPGPGGGPPPRPPRGLRHAGACVMPAQAASRHQGNYPQLSVRSGHHGWRTPRRCRPFPGPARALAGGRAPVWHCALNGPRSGFIILI
jgi:hypothetical protein